MSPEPCDSLSKDHSPPQSLQRGKKGKTERTNLCQITSQNWGRSDHKLSFSGNDYWLIPLIFGEGLSG